MTQTANVPFDWRAEFERLTGAYAPATMRAYIADVASFETWCHTQGCSPFPAPDTTICQFLDDQSQHLSPASVRRSLYSIRKIHRLLGLPDPTVSEDVNLAMRRIQRRTPVRPKQAKGLTQSYLEQFLTSQPTSAIGLRNRAMLAVGYELLNRRSELVALTSDDLTEQSDRTFRILIRRSKSDPYGYGRVAHTSLKTAEILRAWLAVRGPHIPWLFCPVYHHKPINRSLSASTVNRLIKHSARMVGLEPNEANQFSGHSMRVGAAQDLYVQGHDTAAIMRAGGWKSINVLVRYIEHAEHNVWEAGRKTP